MIRSILEELDILTSTVPSNKNNIRSHLLSCRGIGSDYNPSLLITPTPSNYRKSKRKGRGRLADRWVKNRASIFTYSCSNNNCMPAIVFLHLQLPQSPPPNDIGGKLRLFSLFITVGLPLALFPPSEEESILLLTSLI